jgi:ribosomal protein S12 methylthiotransferase
MDEVTLDRVGCFKYEDVAGATSNAFGDQVPQEVKEERYARFMEKAQKISAVKLQAKIGTTQLSIVDAISDGKLICRTRADAPEVDGNAIAPQQKGIRVGDRINLEITDADAYDLYGLVVKH